MAKSKAKAAAAAEETLENKVSTQSADEGIAVQSVANDGIAMFADTGDTDSGTTTPVTPPSQPSQPSADSEEVKWFTYAAYTHGVNFGYANPTKDVYKSILVALDVVDTTTQNAVFKALSV